MMKNLTRSSNVARAAAIQAVKTHMHIYSYSILKCHHLQRVIEYILATKNDHSPAEELEEGRMFFALDDSDLRASLLV